MYFIVNTIIFLGGIVLSQSGLLENVKIGREENNSFELVLMWNNSTNRVKLFQVIPNCRAPATIWNLIREFEHKPILQFVDRVTEEVKLLSNAEMHSEEISENKGRVIFNSKKV